MRGEAVQQTVVAFRVVDILHNRKILHDSVLDHAVRKLGNVADILARVVRVRIDLIDGDVNQPPTILFIVEELVHEHGIIVKIILNRHNTPHTSREMAIVLASSTAMIISYFVLSFLLNLPLMIFPRTLIAAAYCTKDCLSVGK